VGGRSREGLIPGLADSVVLANIVLTVEGGNSLVLHPIGMKSGSGLVRSSGPET
jgi:hypothetical protein